MFFIFFLVLSVVARPHVRSHFTHKQPTPNEVYRAYHDIQGDIFLVDTIEDLRPVHLTRYGAIRITGTESIITNSEVAAKALLQKYHPPRFNFTVAPERKHVLKHDTKFYEVSFAEAKVEKTMSEWLPLSPCHHNEALTKSTYNHGWTVDTINGLNVAVLFSHIFYVSPMLKYDISLSQGVSGSVSCDVELNSTLQAQLRTELVTVSGVRMREVTVRRNFKFTDGKFARLEFEEFELVDEYEMINKRSVVTACVTKKEMLICDQSQNEAQERESED